MVSVVIPALNEDTRIGAAIDSAWSAGAAEVLVADGGSRDDTIDVARARGAVVLEAAGVRGQQLNRGAAAATGAHVIFLHADTLLPPGACEAVARSGARFGGFRLAFLEPARRLRVAAFMINLRTSLTRCPWGDQAQFVERESFLSMGGYREIPLMEDYDLAVRMGGGVVLPLTVRTSGRRFLEQGLLRTSATNWRVIIGWRLGVDPETLARWYRGRGGS